MKKNADSVILARKLPTEKKGTLAMAKLKIREIAEKKGITTAYQLQQLLGVQSTVAYRLWRGKSTMIALSTIQLLCDKLRCTVGQLIELE